MTVAATRVAPQSASPAANRSTAADSWDSSKISVLQGSAFAPEESSATVVRISTLEVTFVLDRLPKLRKARHLRLRLRLGPTCVTTHKVKANVCQNIARVTWTGDWQLALPPNGAAVVGLELESVGLLRSTTLAQTSIDLAKIPVGVEAQHSIVFAFGTLFAQLQLGVPDPSSNPLLGTTHKSQRP
eukprot:RCo048142